jgi:hypothetical protein
MIKYDWKSYADIYVPLQALIKNAFYDYDFNYYTKRGYFTDKYTIFKKFKDIKEKKWHRKSYAIIYLTFKKDKQKKKYILIDFKIKIKPNIPKDLKKILAEIEKHLKEKLELASLLKG